MVKVYHKNDNYIPMELQNEYKHKRDKAEILCSNRREKYFSEHIDLKEVIDKLSSMQHKKGIALIDNNDLLINEYSNKIKDLIIKRDELLKKYNINDFNPIYDCKICSDNGIVDGKKCTCFENVKQEYIKNHNEYDYSDEMCFQNDTFDSIDYSLFDQKNVSMPSEKPYVEYMKNNIAKIKQCIDNLKNQPISILLMGPVGTGKTFVSNCIVNEALEKDLSVIYISSIDLVDSFFEEDKDDTLQKLYKVDLLVIDDLGTEYMSEYSNAILFSIIDKRINYNKATVISTNLSYDEIKNYYKERVASRIANEYNLFKLYGRDLRIKF